MLNRDVTNFGVQHLFDGSEETCWNSHQVRARWSHYLTLFAEVFIRCLPGLTVTAAGCRAVAGLAAVGLGAV